MCQLSNAQKEHVLRYAVTALHLQGFSGKFLMSIVCSPQCDDTSAFKLNRSEHLRWGSFIGLLSPDAAVQYIFCEHRWKVFTAYDYTFRIQAEHLHWGSLISWSSFADAVLDISVSLRESWFIGVLQWTSNASFFVGPRSCRLVFWWMGSRCFGATVSSLYIPIAPVVFSAFSI